MSKAVHGSVMSYLVGFQLSLVFTLIPYLLVVNHSLTGTRLLTAIVGLALIQMVIQILFFLHLGRGPKPLYNVAFFVATVGIIVIIIVGSLFIMSHLHYNMTPSEASQQLAESEAIYQVEGTKTGACHGVKANHKVIIADGKASPLHTDAQLCDTITFISQDTILHLIGFGGHPVHDSYAGQDDLDVRKGHNYTLTLNQAGTYQFHDHLHPEVVGSFTVTP